MLLTPPDEGPRVKGGRLKLQDVVNGEYEPAKLNGEWVSSTEFLYLNKWNQIALLSLHTLSENIVLSNTTYVSPADCLVLVYLFIYFSSFAQKTLAPQSFSISADRKYLLLSHNTRKRVEYRHSTMAQYTVFDIVSSESFQLTPRNNNRPLVAELTEHSWPFLQYASFGPRGHMIVMVYNFNIYYTNGIKSIQTYRITNTGVPGVIYNGIADWLYEGKHHDDCMSHR